MTSDEEDTDPDGVIDYKFEEPGVHRLLAAVKEVSSSTTHMLLVGIKDMRGQNFILMGPKTRF